MYYIGGYIAIAKPASNPTTKIGSGGASAIAFFYIWTIFYGPVSTERCFPVVQDLHKLIPTAPDPS